MSYLRKLPKGALMTMNDWPLSEPADAGTISGTLGVPTPVVPQQKQAVIGVDPGARWTAAVLRVGDAVVNGWTLGPVDTQGNPRADALDDPDDLAALGRYVSRIAEALDSLADQAEREFGGFRIGVETIRLPVGYRHGKASNVSVSNWLTPRSVAVAVIALYPAARLVLPGQNGSRDDYPAELRRRRPPGWGVNEAPRGERDHERSAYDVAGRAAAMP